MDINYYQQYINDSILYYPSIELLDDSFIKVLLSTWDRIYRIVPNGYIPNDSDEIKVAVAEGVLVNIRLTNKELDSAAENFLCFVNDAEILPAGLEGNESVNLHKDKVDQRLYPYLKSLAKEVCGDWLTLSSEVAHGYMIYLAHEVSKNRNIPQITDNPDVHALMTFFKNEGNFDEFLLADNREKYYSNLFVPMMIPDGIRRVSIDKVLRFREETIDGRNLFRNTIENFIQSIQNINDEEHAKHCMNKFRSDLVNSRETILTRGGKFFRKFVPSLMTVGVPTTISALGLLGASEDVFTNTSIGNSVMIGAIAALSDAGRDSGWSPKTTSYFLQMNDIFNDDGINISARTPRYDRILEKFIND